LAIKKRARNVFKTKKYKNKTAIHVKMHLGEASTFYLAAVAAMRNLAPKNKILSLDANERKIKIDVLSPNLR
jgi:L-alanine-DL-glutamate epimerase-like enolase superfamily enzyme